MERRLRDKKIAIGSLYAREDTELWFELERHLRPLLHSGFVRFHESIIAPGFNWREAIENNFYQSDIILILLSADLFASSLDFGSVIELVMQRHARGEVRVIPIIARPVNFEGVLGHLQALPRDGRPITTWPSRDEAWITVAYDIRRIIEGNRTVPSADTPDTSIPSSGHSFLSWIVRWCKRMLALFSNSNRSQRLFGQPAPRIVNSTSQVDSPNFPSSTNVGRKRDRYRLDSVFLKSGVPSVTFVAHEEFLSLVLAIAQPGRGVIVEGPSGIGKTTSIRKAIDLQLGKALERDTRILSARNLADVDALRNLRSWHKGTVIVDDFHRLDENFRLDLVDYIKLLADSETGSRKLIIVGIPRTGQSLVDFSFDIATRIDVYRLGRVNDEIILKMIQLGEEALNIEIERKVDIVLAANGSLNIAQYICFYICVSSQILETQTTRRAIKHNIINSIDRIQTDLARKFAESVRCFAALGSNRQRATLRIIEELGRSREGFVSFSEIQRIAPELTSELEDLGHGAWMHGIHRQCPSFENFFFFDPRARALIVDDPQLTFYLHRLSIAQLAKEVGKNAIITRKSIFVCYSRKDAPWLERLQVHLKPLVRDGLLDLWDDSRIRPGMRWRDEIQTAMDRAGGVVAFISADFLASSFIQDYELPQFLRRAREKGLEIIPVVVSASLFSMSELSEFQAINDPEQPLNSLTVPEQETILVKLAMSILESLSSK